MSILSVAFFIRHPKIKVKFDFKVSGPELRLKKWRGSIEDLRQESVLIALILGKTSQLSSSISMSHPADY